MASLQDTIRKNGKLVRGEGGVLSEEAPEELQSLSAKAGLPAPPMTPMGAAAIGANPDQQKMMGSPTQKQAALQLAQQPIENTLSGAMRREQSRTQATGQEQAAMQKSQDMQNLGSLGDRVNDFVNAQRQKLASTQGVQVQAAAGTIGPSNTDLSTVKPLLDQLRANPTDQQTMLKVNQALGYDINTQLSPDQINQLYESSVDSISRAGGQAVDDSLKVNDLIAGGKFGYDANQLAQLLGVSDPNAVAQMSVGELRNAIAAEATKEQSQTANLQQKAQSGELGQAERGLAQKGLREASSTGIRSSEADVQHLESQIANADQVSFGGKQYKVDDLLRDDTISGIISDYMNSAPGSDTRNQIDKSEPGLSQFIQKNQALLDDASKQMQSSAQQFQATQAHNKQIATQFTGGIGLDDNVAKALIPNYGQLSATNIDPNSVPALAYLSKYGPEVGKQFANLVNAEQQNDPNFAQEIQGLTPEQLEGWAIGRPNGNFERYYLPLKRQAEEVSRIDPSDSNKLVSTLVPDVASVEDAQNRLSKNRANNVLGLPSTVNSTILDSNGDGIVDDPDTIRANFNKLNPMPSLAAGADKLTGYTKGQLGQPVVPQDPVSQSVVSKLGNLAQKGKVTGSDLRGAGLSMDELLWLQDNRKGKVDYAAVDNIQNEKKTDNTHQIIDYAAQSPGDAITRLENALKDNNPRAIDTQAVQAALDNWKMLRDRAASSTGRGVTGGISSAVGQTGPTGVINTALGTVGAGSLNPVGGGDGCFLSGTMFRMTDRSIREIENIQPGDYMYEGGRVIATAQFMVPRIYNYRGVLVSGTHAVLEDGTWMRVENSIHAEYMPEHNNSKVYVVWNENHRMITRSGITFADYAETDSTAVEIERQRNIDELNRIEQSSSRK